WILPGYGDSQTRAWSLEVVVCLRPGSGPEFFLVIPFGHHILVVDRSSVEIVTCRFLSRTRVMSGGVISEYQDVLLFLVAEVIEDSFFFHQPRHKVEISLSILHAVFARREIAV